LERFNEARILSRVTESVAKPINCRIEPVLEIHEGVSWPELTSQLLPADNAPRAFQQQRKDLKWLTLESDLRSIPV